MSDLEALLARCRERDAVFTPEPKGDLQVQTLTPRPDELREELKYDRQETLALLRHQWEQEEGTQIPLTDEARAFLEQHVSPAVLEVFPEWQGLLIGSSALGGAVWVVRDHQNGRRLAQETSQPFILLDEVLGQKGRTSEEARETLLPWRKIVGRKQAKSRMHKINGIGHTATAELTPR